jgi:hypothetical protein
MTWIVYVGCEHCHRETKVTEENQRTEHHCDQCGSLMVSSATVLVDFHGRRPRLQATLCDACVVSVREWMGDRGPR